MHTKSLAFIFSNSGLCEKCFASVYSQVKEILCFSNKIMIFDVQGQT